ncbi:MAG: VCBS repeat-containing protein, partial [Luteimonas sp.]
MALFAIGFCSQALAATTYYVRTDGGDATQCTGRGDAAYSGSGTAQNCAWKSPHYALPASGALRIKGGDTLIIGSGSYMIGWGAPGAAGGRCYEGGPYDCYLPPIPSGPSATAKTRILGRGYDSGCTARPKFWGNNRVTEVLNLDGSSNVEVGCLEITDQSDCVEFHSDAAVRCARDNPPYGAWASIGVTASQSSNVWLHDLNIHGLANRGLMAGGLTNWTLDRVKINANGWAGWDGDIGSGSSNSGQIVLRNIEIGWNGCGERWQTGVIHSCWAQQGGGYGDGLGTATTGGQWTIEDAYVHNNTSDGIDLLYLDGAVGTSAVMRRVRAVANAGNQLKSRGTVTIENSIVDAQCSYFNGKYDMVAGDSCRALGNALSVTLAAGQTATIRHNTITGEGDCLILTEGGSSTSHVYIQNNALIGQNQFGGGELTCGHYANESTALVTYLGNAFWNVKQNQCPTGSVCSNPKLTNMTMANFDAKPISGSPLIDHAPLLVAVALDYYAKPRPFGTAADIGAIEIQGSGLISDVNGDGKSDVLWSLNSDVSYWLMNGHVATLKAYAGSGGTGFKIGTSGDYNGDGYADLVWTSPTQLKFG